MPGQGGHPLHPPSFPTPCAPAPGQRPARVITRITDMTPNLPTKDAAIAAQALELLKPLGDERAIRIIDAVQDSIEAAAPERFAFARGIAGPLGKLICVARTKIDEITFGLLLQLCAARRIDVATLLRDCIYAVVHGKTYQQMVLEKINHEAKHTEALAKLIAPFGSTEFGGGQHD